MNNIHIIPFAGLCNRMRALASGVWLAQHYGYPTTIYWNNTNGLKADFSDLFEPIKLHGIHLIENRKWLFNIGYKHDYLLRWPLLKSKYQTFYNFDSHNQHDITKLINTNDKKDLMLISCFSMSQHYPINQLFIPKRTIMEEINRIVENYSANTFGVHIRRTDNKESIRRSPTESFIELMDREIAKDNNARFFVASDDNTTKKLLKARYPQNVITPPSLTDRNSIEGMQAAVIELFCLSKTKKVFGSCYSSYSEIAAEIGGISLEYARSSENGNMSKT